MSSACWQDSLKTVLERVNRPDRTFRVAVVGVGHELRGDDAAGLAVVRMLQPHIASSDTLMAIEGGPAPENVSGALQRFRPDLVLFVDAAQLDLPAGEIRWLRWQDAGGVGASTHAPSLSLLGHYLMAELGCEVGLLGIQMADNTLDAPLSPAVAQAVSDLAVILVNSVAQP